MTSENARTKGAGQAPTQIQLRSGKDHLYAVARGRGPAIIFYHGALGTHDDSITLLSGLVDSHTVITPDARAMGRSRCPHPDCLNWGQYAEDVIRLMDHLGLESAVLGGSSLGSGITLAAALRFPNRFNALVLSDAPFLGNSVGLLPKQRESRPPYITQQLGNDGAAAIIDAHLARCGDPALTGRFAKQLSSHDPASLETFWLRMVPPWGTAGQPFDHLSELAVLTMPVLVIPGRDDMHAREVSDAYLTAIPDAVLAPVELPEEAPDSAVLPHDDAAGADAQTRFLTQFGAQFSEAIRSFLEVRLGHGDD